MVSKTSKVLEASEVLVWEVRGDRHLHNAIAPKSEPGEKTSEVS